MTEETAAALGRSTGTGIADILIFAVGVYAAIMAFKYLRNGLIKLDKSILPSWIIEFGLESANGIANVVVGIAAILFVVYLYYSVFY